MAGMFVCETANATCGVLMPYAVNRIITAVTRRPSASAQLMPDERPYWVGTLLTRKAG